MKTLISMIIGFCFIGTALAEQPKDTQKRTAEHKILKRLAGNWTWTGEQVDIDAEDSPYGQGGKFSGSSKSPFYIRKLRKIYLLLSL